MFQVYKLYFSSKSNEKCTSYREKRICYTSRFEASIFVRKCTVLAQTRGVLVEANNNDSNNWFIIGLFQVEEHTSII